MTSLIEKELIAAGEHFVYDNSDWITLYYDTGHKVTSDDGGQYAYRAVTRQGEVLWLVFTEGKTRGFHAETACPFEAFEQARSALEHRRRVRADWEAVTDLARRLRTGRARLEIRIEDAENSALCAMGVRHFMRRLGMSRVRRMPGSALAWMMLFEPQLGFIIHESALRQFGPPPEPESAEAAPRPVRAAPERRESA